MSADARVVELERQLSTLAVLQSVYCMDGEFATTDETAALLEAYNDGKDLNALLSASTTAQATLRVHLSEENIKQVSLNIHWLQRRGLDDAAAAAAEPLRIRPTQPTWLSRRAFEDLSSRFQARIAELPEDEKEDEVALVAFAVETVKELAIETQAASGQNNGATALANSASDTLV